VELNKGNVKVRYKTKTCTVPINELQDYVVKAVRTDLIDMHNENPTLVRAI